MNVSYALTIQDLAVGYQGHTQIIIKVPDLTLRAGVITCITGPNGAGKSTLLAALAGLPSVQVTGRINWQDREWSLVSLHMRARAGFLYIPQHSLEIPGLAVHNLIMSALRARSITVSPDEVISRVQDAYIRVGLSYDPGNPGLHVGLSGGQKRRAELAHILLLEPSVLLIDEVDAHIDRAGRILIADIVSDYLVSHPDTVIGIATHSQELMDHFAARYVSLVHAVIEHGTLVADMVGS